MQGYNAQIAVDGEARIIVAVDVVQAAIRLVEWRPESRH